MWKVSGYNIEMTAGDYGIILPVIIHGATLEAADSVKIRIVTENTQQLVLEKTYSGPSIEDNVAELSLTAADSALLRVGNYLYSLDWLRNGSFLCNIVEEAQFKVVKKV